MKVVVSLLLCCLLGFGATINITGPNGNAKAGSTVQLVVSISGASNIAAVEVGVTSVGGGSTVVANSSLTNASKLLYSNIGSQGLLTLGTGMNQNIISDGNLFSVSYVVPMNAPNGAIVFSLNNLSASDALGNAVPLVAGIPFTLNTTSLCGATVTQSDLDTIANQIVSGGVCSSDLNSDGQCNAQDAQILATAGSGGGCNAK